MRAYEKFLFYYGIIVATAIGLGSLFFAPQPQNFAVLLMFIPVIFYFWIRVTSPADVSSSKWSLRLILVVFIVTALGIFGYSLSQKQVVDEKAKQSLSIESQTLEKLDELKGQLEALSESGADSDEIADDVARIKDELSQLKDNQDNFGGINPNLLGAIDSLGETAVGYITISKSTTKELDVLDGPDFSAKSVGKIVYGTNYEYFQKESTWYQITLAEGIEGWVNARSVKEVNVTPTP